MVDDSPTAVIVLKEILTLLNFDVLTAKNGQEALEMFKRQSGISLVITDYEMPVMDGVELTIRIREIADKSRIAIIGLSASDRSDLGAMFLKKGANDFLLKPWSFEELLCRINMNMDTLEHMDYIETVVHTDSLTGLYNRRYLQSQLNTELGSVNFSGENLILALLKVDKLNTQCQTLTEEDRNDVSVHVSEQMQRFFSNQLVARFAAEKFAVLLRDISNADATSLLIQFQSEVSSIPVQLGSNSVTLSVSVGASDNTADSLDDMVEIADDNLFRAQRRGTNQLVFEQNHYCITQ